MGEGEVRVKIGPAQGPDSPILPAGLDLDDDQVAGLNRMIEGLFRPLLAHVSEQSAATGRWLLGALLAVNAGALVAVLSADGLPIEELQASAVAWLCGVVFALLTGVGSYAAGTRGAKELVEVMTHFEVAIMSKYLRALDWAGMAKRMGRRGLWAQIPAAVSAAAFILGAALAIPSLRSTDEISPGFEASNRDSDQPVPLSPEGAELAALAVGVEAACVGASSERYSTAMRDARSGAIARRAGIPVSQDLDQSECGRRARQYWERSFEVNE